MAAAQQPVECATRPALSTGPGEKGDWPTYHRTPDRSGVDVSSRSFKALNRSWGLELDGPIYANPLLARGLVIVATERDTVYALEARTGCMAWASHIGEPVDATKYKCGNIPLIGVTSTPVVDLATNTVYAVGFVQPAHHELFALDLATGAVRWHRPADAPGTDPTLQLQRAALLAGNGRVYVSMGGRAGDCGDFHGYVEAFRLDGSGAPERYMIPTAREGGIWAPGGPALLPNGDLLVPVGNTDSQDPNHYDGGNSVTRLTPDLRLVSLYTSPNWVRLNTIDFDFGSTTPVQVGGGLVFQSGKDGIAYLLDADHLDQAPVASQPLGGCYAIGAAAFKAPFVYVTCDHGMKAVRVDQRSISVEWIAPDFRSGSPIVSGGVVWNIDFEGGHLWGFDASSGSLMAKARIPVAQHFVSPSAADNRLYVPAGSRLLTYTTGK